MIISHKHKYLFVELPRTASTSISKELQELYDGEKILSKHAFYWQFAKIASEEEKKYFVFSGIRNPIDSIYSRYLKLKSNHKGTYSDPNCYKKNGGWITERSLRQFEFVNQNKADFPTFLQKYYRFAYDDWSSLEHHKFDFVVRFENLQKDFSKVLKLIGIEQKRPLPLVNKTQDKEKNLYAQIEPEQRDRTKAVFGPFMQKWGYEFPSEWGDTPIPWRSQLEFELLKFPRQFYWRYLKYRKRD